MPAGVIQIALIGLIQPVTAIIQLLGYALPMHSLKSAKNKAFSLFSSGHN